MSEQNNSINCYGNFDSKCSRCQDCVYMESCRYYNATANLVNSRAKLASYEQIQAWLAEAADYRYIPGAEEDNKENLVNMLAVFFRFLLDLDDYSIGVISEIISPSDGEKECTVSKLGRLHGCSRQAMHRKMLYMISRHPELASLLKSTMYKLSSSRQMFLRRKQNSAAAR